MAAGTERRKLNVQCRLIGPADVDAAAEVMLRSGVHLAGSRSLRVFRAIARDAVRDPTSVIIPVAVTDTGALAAIAIALTRRARYWRTFGLRHPVEAAEMALHRVARTVRRRVDRSPAPVDPETAARQVEARRLCADRIIPLGRERWTDDDPDIAKMMMLAVDPAYRNGGVSTTLFRWLFAKMKAMGLRRCDGNISTDNVAAVKMDRQFPFRFHEVPGGYFIWLLLAEM